MNKFIILTLLLFTSCSQYPEEIWLLRADFVKVAND